MSATDPMDRCLNKFEARCAQRPDPLGLVLWTGPIRRIHSDLQAKMTQLAETRRQSYGHLMLAESQLLQLRRELADSPRNAALAKIDSILERIYAAKAALCILTLCLLLAVQFSADPGELRRPNAQAKLVRVIRASRLDQAA